ncbi:MAG: GNAT family N-acetyltransferase [Actinobacteria bacterium]|nr:GNAT family N-acetyltransferase [Actinomycetota bacterium]
MAAGAPKCSSKAGVIEIADSVAARILDQVPFRLGRARTVAQIEEMQRLRAETMIEMGWASSEDFPDGLERDAHDERAIHVGAWDGAQMIGVSRVILPDARGRLPIETDFGVELPAGCELVEIGRVLIVPARRGEGRRALSTALFAHCWREMRTIGYTELVANLPAKLIDVYRGVGFQIEPLGPGRWIWGEERHPVRFDVLGSADSLVAVWLGSD